MLNGTDQEEEEMITWLDELTTFYDRPELEVSGGGGDDGDSLGHVYCCDENRGLCGVDLTGVPIIEEGGGDAGDTCVVCLDLEGGSCGAPGCPVGARALWSW